MDTKEKIGKEYMELLDSLVIGDVLELPSPLPGLSNEKSAAVLVKMQPGTEWKFVLEWFGIETGRMAAKLKGTELLFTVET